VTVTNVPGSPLADLADVAVECGAGVESVVPATKSVTTSMLLLRAMAHPVEPRSVAACADAIEALVAQGVQDVTAVPGFVVAGGLAGQAVADEVALKLAEVAAVAAVPESLVDFLHGPAAVTAPVLALIEGDDPNLGALVTRPDVRLLHVPRSGDRSLDRITQLVAGQLFAVALADFLGVDADDPKGLSKVTLTR
jgi:glucosamine--fructose-6-phosphate aminotransferase (isomerizing)